MQGGEVPARGDGGEPSAWQRRHNFQARHEKIKARHGALETGSPQVAVFRLRVFVPPAFPWHSAVPA